MFFSLKKAAGKRADRQCPDFSLSAGRGDLPAFLYGKDNDSQTKNQTVQTIAFESTIKSVILRLSMALCNYKPSSIARSVGE